VTTPALDPRPLSAALGAEIEGIDLTRPVPPALQAGIMAAFNRHQLLVFRGQRLERGHMFDFASLFGEIEGHAIRLDDGSKWSAVHTITNLDRDGNPIEKPFINSNYFWHSDKSFLPVPSLTTMLHAVELPPAGGDTQFANMAAAYAALPEEMRRRLDGLKVIHSLEHMRRYTGSAPPTEDDLAAAPPVAHPLARTHPETGERSLYIGMYSAGIPGMAEDEGRALIEQLQAHATAPRFVYTHQWRPGDLVMWDNRCLLHRAVANYEMGRYRRVLMRVVVRGTAPY